MILLREYIRNMLIVESQEEPDMTRYVDELEDLIFTFIFTTSTFDQLQSLEPSMEINAVLETNLFDAFDNINEVHIGLTVNDDAAAGIDAAYLCDMEDRSASNLVLTLDLPRYYPEIEEFQDWLSAELADTLSHEIQHSCDTTEMLSSEDCVEGEAKWESTENIERYYGCDAEVRGHVAGILGRSRRTGQEPQDLLQYDMETIMGKASSKGYTEQELIPVIQNIYKKWLDRLESLL
ncbi:MAG TPA: hypothetical protein EYF95_01810 [Flavobacteriales bacterium]|jgi:hypothetical protein|nr:hypothetical protein [Flavobacteriales bacterium]